MEESTTSEGQTKKVEFEHHRIYHNIDEVLEQQRRLETVGPVDQKATDVFRNHRLDGQDYIRGGDGVHVYRALLDPEEKVVRVTGKHCFLRLVELVEEDRLELRNGRKKYPGVKTKKPIDWGTLEMVVGDVDYPDQCYRFDVRDMDETEDGLIEVQVVGNIEHEKTDFFSVRHSDDPPGGGSGLASLSVRIPDDFEADMEPYVHPNRAVGGRTGRIIAHQRQVEGSSIRLDDFSTMTFDPERDSLWVVVLDAQLYSKMHGEKREEFKRLSKG